MIFSGCQIEIEGKMKFAGTDLHSDHYYPVKIMFSPAVQTKVANI
jgi:hypothetical protein